LEIYFLNHRLALGDQAGTIFDRDAEWGQLARFAARVGQRVTTGSPPAAGD
jgi:hypothetical protein